MNKKHTEIEVIDSEIRPTKMGLNGTTITEQDALDGIDNLIDGLYETGDTAPVDATLKSLIAMQRIAGKSLAKLLWGYKQWWDATGQSQITGDTFEDRTHAIHGLNKTVLGRYVLVWDSYERNVIPDPVRARPLKDQIAIAKTLEQGYEIKPTKWKELQNAVNNNAVLEILRKIKGKAPRKSSVQIVEERDGNIVAWDSEGGRHTIGWLNVEEEKDDPVIQKALSRIRNSAGIYRR